MIHLSVVTIPLHASQLGKLKENITKYVTFNIYACMKLKCLITYTYMFMRM